MTALYRKYRPEDFDEMYGNDTMLSSLKSTVVNEDRRPNTFLLHGPSGCGKTTLARIISGYLECEKPKEYNISKTRGIDAARDIIEKIHYHTFGVSRVIILNEVHKATNEFQNAMLEVLEEPPEGTYFILCTTEPEKLIKTVLTRCTQFQVAPLNRTEMKDLVSVVLDAEEVELPPEVINEVVKQSDGLPRLALSVLSGMINMDEDEMEDAIEVVKTNETDTIEICRAISKNSKWKTVAALLKDFSGEPELARYQIMGYFSTILMKKGDSHSAFILSCFTETNFMYSKKAGLVLACYQAVEMVE